MTLILVEHATDKPALFGALAACLAATRRVALAHLPARFDLARYPDAVQHPAAIGTLVPSGLLWFERLTNGAVGAAATPQAILGAATRADVVVPLHAAVQPAEDLAEALVAGARAAGPAVERLRVVETDGTFRLHPVGGGAPLPGAWTRDRFGRLGPDDRGPGGSAPSWTPLRIALVGRERDHRDVYPGALAALGDAADAGAFDLDVHFVDPATLRPGEEADAVAEVGGLLLPGGSDMANVPGQIRLARAALDRGLPAAGLCLGMQTMVTAFAQRMLGRDGVNLAEADPDARLHSFVAMSGDPSFDAHRVGEHETRLALGTRYGAMPGAPRRERYNHRFRLNPALIAPLAAAGLRVAAQDRTGLVTDAVEVAAHPFFIGLQGHPELASRPGRPHPLISALLSAAKERPVTQAGALRPLGADILPLEEALRRARDGRVAAADRSATRESTGFTGTTASACV